MPHLFGAFGLPNFATISHRWASVKRVASGFIHVPLRFIKSQPPVVDHTPQSAQKVPWHRSPNHPPNIATLNPKNCTIPQTMWSEVVEACPSISASMISRSNKTNSKIEIDTKVSNPQQLQIMLHAVQKNTPEADHPPNKATLNPKDCTIPQTMRSEVVEAFPLKQITCPTKQL